MGCGASFGIDARGAEKQEPPDPGRVRGVEEVRLNTEVVVQELDRAGGIREDAANSGGGDDDDVRPGRQDGIESRRAVAEVELRRPPSDETLEAAALQLPPNR